MYVYISMFREREIQTYFDIFIHIHKLTYVFTSIHIYIYIYRYICIYMYIYIYMYTYICVFSYVYLYTYTHFSVIFAFIHVFICVYRYVFLYIYVHRQRQTKTDFDRSIHMYKLTYAYTSICIHIPSYTPIHISVIYAFLQTPKYSFIDTLSYLRTQTHPDSQTDTLMYPRCRVEGRWTETMLQR